MTGPEKIENEVSTFSIEVTVDLCAAADEVLAGSGADATVADHVAEERDPAPVLADAVRDDSEHSLGRNAEIFRVFRLVHPIREDDQRPRCDSKRQRNVAYPSDDGELERTNGTHKVLLFMVNHCNAQKANGV